LRAKKLLLVLLSSLYVIYEKIIQSGELFNTPHEL
jgi:hypothetical protein